MPRRASLDLLLFASLAMQSFSSAAQQLIAPPVNPPTRPQLVISSPVELPVILRTVSVDTEIIGSLAQTSVELAFYNPNRRDLEGELQFPLPDGHSVTGLAMELNGKLREAVPIEKTRGQMVFEEVTRAQIDPALLQMTQGNNYKLRVYPISAQKEKRVVIRYAASVAGAQGKLLYPISLDYAEKLARFSLRVRVCASSGEPVVSAGVRTALPQFAFTRDGADYVAQFDKQDFIGRGALEIGIPISALPQAFTQHFDGDTYFHVEVPVKTRTAPRPTPKVIGLLWDSSASGAKRMHARELALLDVYFEKLRDVEVRFYRIRESVESPQTFSVRNGDWRVLRSAIENTVYDGATNLGAIQLDRTVDAYLLFTDGLANFGDQSSFLARNRGSGVSTVPVHTFLSAVKVDAALLRSLAHQTSGRFIDLTTAATKQALEDLMTYGTRVIAVTGEQVRDVMFASPYPSEGRLSVSGILTEASATLRLSIGTSERDVEKIDITLSAKANVSTLVAPLWARSKIAQLEAEYDFHRAEIQRLGKKFSLVTRETSLIVLDRVEDYVRFEIMPPSELLTDYQRLLTSTTRQRERDRHEQIERVVRLFQEKVKWWQREFPQRVRPALKEKDLSGTPNETERLADAITRAPVDLPRSDSPPPPPPAPVVPAPSAARRPEEQAEFRKSQPAGQAGGRIVAEPQRSRASHAQNEITRERSGARAGTAIALKKWTPDAPYLKRMREARSEDIYRIYLDEKPGYSESTAFFLDVADILFDKGMPALGVRVLSNLAEMDLENRHILRILGYRFMQAQRADLAIRVFKKVLEWAPEEPQSYRDLALAYAAQGEAQSAVNLLYEVVRKPWHGRFPEIELIALAELNAIVATTKQKLDVNQIDSRLRRNLPLDLRVVLTWDADNTDIDLWVTDPNGEKAYYGHRLTGQGGRMSLDFTGGYGPEEFSLKKARPGKYKIEAQFYGHRQQIVAGATTLQVKLQTQFGLSESQEKIVTLRLKGQSEVIQIGEFEVK